MAFTLYVASSNPGKLRDFRVAAAAQEIAILPLPGLESIEAPPEDAETFEGNATEKAIYYSRFLPGEMVMADDSGIEVDALGGAPGVRSARFSPDGNNNRYLLQQLAGVPAAERGARYRCVLAVARDGKVLLTADGSVEGRVLDAPRGSGGFGYDPLFYLPALDHTTAELDDRARWDLSHRGNAFRALITKLAPYVSQVKAAP
jgi:XTP/dITP diphosphohydrolase